MDGELLSDGPRHPLLPDPGSSRAVLVGSDQGIPPRESVRPPHDVAARLAATLGGSAFPEGRVTTLGGPVDAARVLGAVRRAAADASDVLLFYYAGQSFLDAGTLVLGTRACGVPLAAVAALMGTAARPVVVLDCDHASAAPATFAALATEPALLAAGESSFTPMSLSFTATLLDALRSGVHDGPDPLDLPTLRDAIDAAHREIRSAVETEWITGPIPIVLHPGPEVALGVNPAAGGTGPRRRALPANAAVLDQGYL
jgi:hypothetical protein